MIIKTWEFLEDSESNEDDDNTSLTYFDMQLQKVAKFQDLLVGIKYN